MAIEKTMFSKGTDNDLNIGVFFTKVDRKNRTVSGFATLDNIDDHGDRVSADGSRSAFKRFRGGLREMHLPNAVGTLVNFEEIKKYDDKTDKVYEGIHVTAKVSKGAEDTWEKVLDGTYKGFSIGGKIKRKSKQYTDDGVEYGVIDDYDLIELSLVDNPANPLATVLTVQKIGDRYVYPEDETVEKQVLNILLHDESGDVILSEDAERDGFENIGWTDTADNTDKIRAALDDYREKQISTASENVVMNPEKDEPVIDSEGFRLFKNGNLEFDEGSIRLDLDENNVPVLLNDKGDVILRGMDNTDEGGATVATDTKTDENVTDQTTDEEVEKSADVDEVESAEDNSEEVEKAADVTEVTDEADTTADDLVQKVQAAVADVLAQATDAAKESKDAAASAQTSFEKSVQDFEKTISDLKSEFKKDLEGLAKRVEDVESDTAVKKSSDVVEDDDEGNDNEEESFWRGSGFLSANDLVKG